MHEVLSADTRMSDVQLEMETEKSASKHPSANVCVHNRLWLLLHPAPFPKAGVAFIYFFNLIKEESESE